MDKPWRHRPEWADGRVKEQSHQSVVWMIGWLFCLLWFGGLAATFSFLPPPFGPDGVGPSAFVLVMMAAGLLPLALTIQGTRAAMSAPAVFEMATFPGVIGGALRGRIRIPGDIELRQCTLTLLCGVRRRPGRDTRFAWMDVIDVPPTEVRREGRETVVPVEIVIPYGLRQTEEGDGERVDWHCMVELKKKGWGSRQYNFILPVFYTEDSLQSPAPPPRVHKPPACRIRVEERGYGTILRLPVSRHVLTFAVGPQLLAAVLIAANSRWDMDLPVGWILAIPELAALLAFSELVTRPRRIEVEPGFVRVVRPFGRREVLPASEIEALDFQLESGLEARLRNGERRRLAVIGPDEDDWLEHELERAMARARRG